MLNDERRNRSLVDAINRAGLQGSTVLDIGSGSGLLAMLAARAGARHVVTCEAVEPVARVAREIIAANGLSDRITVVNAMSTSPLVAAALGRPATHLVTEIVDCGLLGEGLLPTLRHARAHLLAPDAHIIPFAARIRGCLLESEEIHRNNFVGAAGGLDVSLFNTFSTRDHFPVRLETWPHRRLSAPRCLRSFDLARDELTPAVDEQLLHVEADGIAHGALLWFELDLDAGLTVSNSPDAARTHWMQAVYLFDEPRRVERHQRVRARVAHDDHSLSLQLS